MCSQDFILCKEVGLFYNTNTNKNIWFIIRDRSVKYFLEPTSNHSFLDHPQERFWFFNSKKTLDSWFEKLLIYGHFKYFVFEVWFGKYRWYRNIREVTRVIHLKTPGLYQVPNWSYSQKNCKKSQFLIGCVIFDLTNFLWGDLRISGKSLGSSTRKPQVSIT